MQATIMVMLMDKQQIFVNSRDLGVPTGERDEWDAKSKGTMSHMRLEAA
jgi:hypothetical protein